MDTPAATTYESQFTDLDLAAGFLRYFFIQFLRNFDLGQIRHRGTVGTHEVDMGHGVAGEPLYTVYSADAYDLSLLFE